MNKGGFIMYWYLNNDTSFKKNKNLCQRAYFNKIIRNRNVSNKYDFNKIMDSRYRNYFKGVGHIQVSMYVRHNNNMYKQVVFDMVNLSINIDKIVRKSIVESVNENGVVDKDKFNEIVNKKLECIYDEIEGKFERYVDDLGYKY